MSDTAAAAAASESTYCAALNATFTNGIRATSPSATIEAAASATAAGSGPSRRSAASAKAEEVVTRSSPSRLGTSIGSSSPSSTIAPMTSRRQSQWASPARPSSGRAARPPVAVIRA